LLFQRLYGKIQFKAHYSISYADVFVVALPLREDAVILTGNPEFKTLMDQVRIEWLCAS